MAYSFQYQYRVMGSGEFPLDMLRRDHANFAHKTDMEVAMNRTDLRSVLLVGVDRPNVERWSSFSWTVTTNALTGGNAQQSVNPTSDIPTGTWEVW